MEVPFSGPADLLFALAEHVEAAGLRPVIAHPERTEAVLEDPAIADELAARGWMLQVNATSLTGRHGPEPEELGWSLLERGLGKLVASDGHRTTRPAHLDDAHALAEHRLGERALSLFDGSALGVTQSRTASRAASTGA
jgi:protein-tyrosine phosphatase